MEWFVFLAVHDIRSIFLQHHISKASIFFRSDARIVHDSESYRKIKKTNVRTSLGFVTLEALLLRQLRVMYVFNKSEKEFMRFEWAM